MNRSRALLRSLGNEKERWEAGSDQFKSQMSTIVGDVLLSSAFMAYGGDLIASKITGREVCNVVYFRLL